MTTNQSNDPLRPAQTYRITVLNEDLEENHIDLADPVPTGRQILHSIGIKNIDDFSLYAITPIGDFEDVRPDETYDPRMHQASKFFVFQTDRAFKFKVNHNRMEWGQTKITGFLLKQLANVDYTTHEAWLNVPGCEKQIIDDDQIVDLSSPGVEDFHIQLRQLTIIVNGREKVTSYTKLNFCDIVALAFPGAAVDDTTAYTMTHTRGPTENPEGSLVVGQTLAIIEGQVINVTATNKS